MEEKAATYSDSVNSSYDCDESLFDDNGIPFTFGTYTPELLRQKNGKGHAIPPQMLARLKLLLLLKRDRRLFQVLFLAVLIVQRFETLVVSYIISIKKFTRWRKWWRNVLLLLEFERNNDFTIEETFPQG